jgi:hypothetical protein
VTVPVASAVRRGRARLRNAQQTAPVRRPSSLAEALATLDRLARYCEFSCALEPGGCLEARCEAWNLERAAVDRLAGRWLDGQD